MKRDPNLYPLSWQHQNGLMAVLLLKKGISKGADVLVMSDFIHSLWEAELKDHFLAEEEALVPGNQQQHQAYYQQLKTEHQLLVGMIETINRQEADLFLIDKFQQQLEQHIRFEEREFFPWLEQHFSAAELEKMGEQLQHLPSKTCVNYKVKFWE